MPYHGYLLYQAERVWTPAEQRSADARLGRRAAALAHVFRSIARPARAPRRQTATGRPGTGRPGTGLTGTGLTGTGRPGTGLTACRPCLPADTGS